MNVTSFQSMSHALDDLRNGKSDIAAFCAVWRTHRATLADLPPRYLAVMDDLLVRLETGSLFTEESCSFSQEDLHGAFATWLQKASSLA